MRKNICTNCGKVIPTGTLIGSGKKSEGIFCSLGCSAEYNKGKLLKRARKVQADADRHRNS
jgi:hypothetical protein